MSPWGTLRLAGMHVMENTKRASEDEQLSGTLGVLQANVSSFLPSSGHLSHTHIIRHAEAIQYLYELNRFWTRTTDVLQFLPRLLTTESLNRIRYLNFLYLVGDPPSLAHSVHRIDNPKKMEKRNQKEHEYRKSWNAVWKTLSEMEGLVELKVQIIVVARRGSIDLWKVEDFKIITSVNRPKRFVLILPDELVRLLKHGFHAENLEVEGFMRNGGSWGWYWRTRNRDIDRANHKRRRLTTLLSS